MTENKQWTSILKEECDKITLVEMTPTEILGV